MKKLKSIFIIFLLVVPSTMFSLEKEKIIILKRHFNSSDYNAIYNFIFYDKDGASELMQSTEILENEKDFILFAYAYSCYRLAYIAEAIEIYEILLFKIDVSKSNLFYNITLKELISISKLINDENRLKKYLAIISETNNEVDNIEFENFGIFLDSM